MSPLPLFLAAASTADLAGVAQRLAAVARAHISLYGALTTVILLILVWVVFIRKRPDGFYRYRAHHHSHEPEWRPPSSSGEPADGTPRRHRKWHRRRREHRPRNPTLAETGGLPPVRSSRPAGPPPRTTAP